MARVGIDARKWSDFGIGSYLRGLFEELVRLGTEHEYLLFAAPREAPLLPAGPRVRVIPLGDAPYSPTGLARLGALARRHDVELFHAPHYTLPIALSSPSVVTVHDTIHLALAASPWKALYARAMLGRALRQAARVIVPSEAARAGLVARYPGAAARVRAVPNGLAPAFLREGKDIEREGNLPGIPRDYVLFVGNERPYKNLAGVLQAFALIAPGYAGSLVLAGLPLPASGPLRESCRRLGLTERVHLPGHLPDRAMPSLYRRARLLLAPSLMEGFGLPVLEAMSMGTPVVTTRGGAQEEVAGDAALLVDPRDAGAIADAARRLIEDADLRRRLVERGLERARAYRWSRAAQATLGIYREALAAGRAR